MDAILNWMKGILILFLIGHVMLYLVQNKTYEKYVHFFLRILILLAVMAPIASRLIDEDTLIQNCLLYTSREHYEKPSVKRKKKSEAARKRKYN